MRRNKYWKQTEINQIVTALHSRQKTYEDLAEIFCVSPNSIRAAYFRHGPKDQGLKWKPTLEEFLEVKKQRENRITWQRISESYQIEESSMRSRWKRLEAVYG